MRNCLKLSSAGSSMPRFGRIIPKCDYLQRTCPNRSGRATLIYDICQIIELRRKDMSRVAKVGGHVFSYHALAPYPGWTAFYKEIRSVIHTIVQKLKSPNFSRLGFRYINSLRGDNHHVTGLSDTNIALSIGNEMLTGSVNLNYMRTYDTDHTITVKIATPEFVQGNLEPGFSLLCDIDVATKAGASVTGLKTTMAWINIAHDLEKKEFFKILRSEIIERLTVSTQGDHNV